MAELILMDYYTINEVLVNDEDHVNHMPVAEERKNLDFTLTAYNFRVYLKQ